MVSGGAVFHFHMSSTLFAIFVMQQYSGTNTQKNNSRCIDGQNTPQYTLRNRNNIFRVGISHKIV